MHAAKTETIARLVQAVRGERVLFDAELAGLYGVSTKALNQAVKRNRGRFPPDFMFRLTAEEWRVIRSSLSASPDVVNRSQIVTGSSKHRDPLYLPYAFTEPFVQLRRLMDSNRQLARKIEAIEKKYDEKFAVVFNAIKRLIAEDDASRASPKRRIGFIA